VDYPLARQGLLGGRCLKTRPIHPVDARLRLSLLPRQRMTVTERESRRQRYHLLHQREMEQSRQHDVHSWFRVARVPKGIVDDEWNLYHYHFPMPSSKSMFRVMKSRLSLVPLSLSLLVVVAVANCVGKILRRLPCVAPFQCYCYCCCYCWYQHCLCCHCHFDCGVPEVLAVERQKRWTCRQIAFLLKRKVTSVRT
jgi:hypothetical protein